MPRTKRKNPDKPTAYTSGVHDGENAVHDAVRNDPKSTIRDVETWFKPGTLDPDESLINACISERLSEVLGLTRKQVSMRGHAWEAALDQYNQGYRTGARRAWASAPRFVTRGR